MCSKTTTIETEEYLFLQKISKAFYEARRYLNEEKIVAGYDVDRGMCKSEVERLNSILCGVTN